jgi:hypothetical protein
MSEARTLVTLRPPTSASDGPLHVGWHRLKAALRAAGIAPGLWKGSLHPWLGPAATTKPEPPAIQQLLESYLGAGARLDEGRLLVHRPAERDSARSVVQRMRALLPELEMLVLADEEHAGRTRLLLRSTGAHAIVAPHHVQREALERPGWERRTVTVDALVEAVNLLLANKRLDRRFLPLDGADDTAAYLAVDHRAATMLDRVDLWAAPLGELDGFACWLDAATRVA